MGLLLTEALPARGAFVSAATHGQSGVGSSPPLLVAAERQVACFAAATAADGDPTLHRLWHQPVGGGRVEHAAPLTPDCSHYLLITSHGSSGPPQAAIVAAESQHCVLTQTSLVCEDRFEQPPAQPAFSNLCSGSSSASVGKGTATAMLLAASLFQGTVHVILAERSAGGTWLLSAAPNNLCRLLTTDPGAVIAVESLSLGPAGAVLPAAAGPGRLHAAILYSTHLLGGGGARLKHVVCLEVEDTSLRSTCWFHRNVHPSTSLMVSLPGARTLVAAADCLALVQADAPQDRQLAVVHLAGQPTCAAALSDCVVVVGDSSGQLSLFDVDRLVAVPVARGLLDTTPSCLAFLPAPTAAAAAAGAAAGAVAPAGVLFVGSRSGGSLAIEVPAAALQGGSDSWHQLGDAEHWQALAGSEAAQLAASLAPVSSCQLITDPSGCGDRRLLMCCGKAPFARLALGRLAASLAPLAVGEGDLPGLVRLLGLKASPAAAAHRYLLLSSDATAACSSSASNSIEGSGWTTVLEAAGGGLQSAVLPGLQLEAATLLASALPGGNMLQVTPQGVFVFRPSTGAAQSSWHPPAGSDGSTVSLAAQQGQYVALACGAKVQVLYCSSSTGWLQEERLLQLPQQASALSLFHLGAGGGTAAVEGELWVAAGCWVSNEVLLQPLSADQPACRLELGDSQPRSLLVCQLGSNGSGSGSGHTYLVVGTSSGELLWWRLAVQHDAFGAHSSVHLEECGWARAGLAPVTLHLLPCAPGAAAATGSSSSSNSSSGGGSGPCILAVSDQSLMLAPDPGHPARLAPVRVHGGQGITAACPLVMEDLPGGFLAYISGGQLAIGELAPDVCLRWDDLALAGGATASSAAYHSASGCAALACTEADGSSSLRLVDAGALRELAKLPLQAGQCITALAVLPLSCSSGLDRQAGGPSDSACGAAGSAAWQQHHSQQRQGPPQQGQKQFLLVAVSEEGAGQAIIGSGDGGCHDPLPLPAETEGSEPWWRQQSAVPAPDQQRHTAAGGGNEGGSLAQLQGSLLVYEVRQAAQPGCSTGASSGSSGGRGHELVLHGRCPLDAAMFSLALVHPEAEPFDAGPAARSGTAASRSGDGGMPVAGQQPLLAVGCQDGTVRLYRIHVDDAGLEAKHAVAQGLAAIAAAPVQLLRLTELSPPAQADWPAGGADEGRHETQASGVKRLWHQHVALQLVAKAPTYWEGCPLALSACGSTLFALDFLSSLTAYRPQPAAPGQLPSLLPLAADLAGRHVSTALPLSDTAIVAALGSGALLLMQRDPAAEQNRQSAARQRWELAQELGAGAADDALGQAGEAMQQQQPRHGHFVPTLQDAVQLDVAASHAGIGSVAGIVPGLLGVPLRQLHELLGAEAGSSSIGSAKDGGPQQHDAPAAVREAAEAATIVYTSGAVASAHLLTAEQQRTLALVQRAAKATADDEVAGGKLRVAAPDAPAPQPGGCINGSLLTAAYQHPAWHQQLLKAAPETAVQQGRVLLEGFGLL